MVAVIGAISALGVPPAAAAEPLCRPSMNGPWEYQAKLGPLVGGFVLAPPAPGSGPPSPPPASTGIGAGPLARQVLGPQYAGTWMITALQGWGVGLAPGPLDPAAAHAAIIDRVAAHYTADETAYLSERLHVDPQPYSHEDLLATQDAAFSTLRADPAAPAAAIGVGCRLSDARRVEVSIYAPATPEQVQRVFDLLAPFGDKVRIELSSHGPPAPAIWLRPPGEPTTPPPPPVAFARHVKMAPAGRCVRGRDLRIAARQGRPAVQALMVRAGGRSRRIAGRRLAKPLTVMLRGASTQVAVTVWLAGGGVGTRTVTYKRCR